MTRRRGRLVLEHPDRATIDRMFLTGWKPSKIHEWLVSRGKTVISVRALAYYRDNHIDVKQILPPSVYEKKLQELDVQIDALQELYNLVEVLKRRLGYLLNLEDEAKVALPDTRKELNLLKDTIVKTIELEMEIGIRSKRPIEIVETKIDLSQLVEEYRAAKHVWGEQNG